MKTEHTPTFRLREVPALDESGAIAPPKKQPSKGNTMKQEMTMHRAYFMGHDSICIHTQNGDSNPFLCRITDDIDGYEEKAAFIVRACNMHDELVAALKGTIDCLTVHELDCARDGLKNAARASRDALSAVRAALAKL